MHCVSWARRRKFVRWRIAATARIDAAARQYAHPFAAKFFGVRQRRTGGDAGGRRANRRAGRQQLLRLQRVRRIRRTGPQALASFRCSAWKSSRCRPICATRAYKVNDPGNPGKTYLCGKGITRFDDMSPEAQRLIDVIRRNDRAADGGDGRSHAEHVAAAAGWIRDVDEQAVVDMIVERHGSAARDGLFAGAAHFAGVSGGVLRARAGAASGSGA